jgi:hypothetical protein
MKTNQRPEKKPIIESYTSAFNAKSLKEKDESNTEKRWFLKGIAAQADIKNGNGRIYPEKILKPAIDQYQYYIENKLPQCMGELAHPSGSNPDRSDSDINFDWVSHMIVELKADPNNSSNYITKSKILKNPIGLNYIVPILEEGITLAFSTRGFGESQLSESEGAEIVSDYQLLTIDLVARPSAPDAYQKGMFEATQKFKKIITESKSGAPKTRAAQETKNYYETLNIFKGLGKENIFVETMEAYNWIYNDFYMDMIKLENMIINGIKI